MSVSKPTVTLNVISAPQVIQNQPQRVLLIGQKISAGSAPSGSLVSSIANDNSENQLFGRNSQLATMVRAFKKVNNLTQVDAIPLSDDGAAVQATATVTFTGPATAAGSLTVSVGSTLNATYTLAITSGESATSIGAALAALITADQNSLVTASASAGVVTLTAVNGGTIANSYGLKTDGTVPGVSVALVGFSGGATNPSLTNLFNVVGNVRYQTIVWPSQYTLSVLTNFLDNRFNVTNAVLDGVGVIAVTDSVSNLVTLGNASNSQSLCYSPCAKAIATSAKIGPNIFEIDFVRATIFAATRSYRLTPGANISRYVTGTVGSSDTTGGPAIASLPYFNTPIYNLPIVPQAEDFTDIEVGQLKTAGISIFGNNITNNLVIMDEQVSTYKTDVGGNPDVTFKYLEVVDTISNIREYIFNNLKNDFSQCRLTTGDLVPGRKMANAKAIYAAIVGYYNTLGSSDYVLVQTGAAANTFFKQNLSVTIDLALGKATISMKTQPISQLRDILGTIQIDFSPIS